MRSNLSVNFLIDNVILATSFDAQGPVFVVEPASRIEFMNTQGGRADCIAKANPTPSVEWYHMDNSIVSTISKVRNTHSLTMDMQTRIYE